MNGRSRSELNKESFPVLRADDQLYLEQKWAAST